MLLKTLQQAKRFLKVLVGFTLVLIGVAMLVMPGPGWLVLALGLALLAGEFVWAQSLLRRLKAGGTRIRNTVLRNSASADRRAP